MSNSNTSCISSEDNPDYYSTVKDFRSKTLNPNDAVNLPIHKNSKSSNSISVPVTNHSRTNSSLTVNGSIDADKSEFWNITNHSELNSQVLKKDLIGLSQTISNDRKSSFSSGLNNTLSVSLFIIFCKLTLGN